MIFVSRDLAPDSPLRSWAARSGRALHAASLLRFAAVDFTPPAAADWWFFYSPRAVAFAGPPPPEVRLAALGPGTARALLERGRPVDFCGDGDPQRVAEALLAVAAGQRVFFPRARQSRRSVQTALADRITVLDAVCYDNQPAPPPAPIAAAVYVFTSPLNAAAYLDHWAPSPGARFIALGPTTAAALRSRGLPVEESAAPTEAGVVALLES